MLKNLKDIILEKLKVDDIVIVEEFPIDGKLDDMIKFLEEKGFKYVHCGGGIDEWFSNYKSKCFYKTKENLWFGDTSKEKISKGNPIFIYRILYNNFGVFYCDDSGNLYWLAGQRDKIKNSKENKEEFLQELNKRFGW